MENFQGNRSKATKTKVPPGMKTQKLILGSGRYHSSSVSPTSFDSENLDLNAPILRYLCGGSPITGKLAPRGSRSPLSAVENLIERSPPPPPAMYRTPVKAVVEEEVFVMDGVPVRRGTRFSGSESSGSSGKSLFKAEIFQPPEDWGDCRYSPKSQFLHGKEVLCPTRLSIKNKTEPQVSRSCSSSPGLSTYIPNCLFVPQIVSPIFSETAMTPTRTPSRTKSGTPIRIASPATSRTPTRTPIPAASATPTRIASPAASATPTQAAISASSETPTQSASPAVAATPIQIASPVTLATRTQTSSVATSASPTRTASHTTASKNTKTNLTSAITCSDWSPQDDGIEVTLPFSSPGKPSSRESVNTYIASVLSGRNSRRLLVFSEICSE